MEKVSVAGIRTFVEGGRGKTVPIGVDVHKRSYSVALLRSDGAWKEWTAPSCPRALESMLLPFRSRIGAVVYEAGPTGFGLARRLTRAGISVIVAAPSMVPGVGETVATTFAAELFRPGRFRHPGEVTSYLGLTPVVRQSGSGKARGQIRPVGQRRLRSLLIEAAWIRIAAEGDRGGGQETGHSALAVERVPRGRLILRVRKNPDRGPPLVAKPT